MKLHGALFAIALGLPGAAHSEPLQVPRSIIWSAPVSIDRLLGALGPSAPVTVPAGARLDRAWIADEMFGGARERMLDPSASFAAAMLEDIAELERGCGGVLDTSFDVPNEAARSSLATATLACTTPRASLLALLFVRDGERLLLLLHEADPKRRAALDAMQTRMRAVVGSR